MPTAFEKALMKKPLPYKMPCAGCQHLRDGGDLHYVRCGFPVPPLPEWAMRAAWGAFDSDDSGVRREYTRKMVFGPFVEVPRVIGCDTFEAVREKACLSG